MEITLIESIMIVAVFLGPIVAVQLTRHLDNRKEARGRKLEIFRSLMVTRVYRTSWKHVEALNLVAVEFKNEKEVLDAWGVYLDHLGKNFLPAESWISKQVELLVDLLQKMSKVLGFDFNKSDIENYCYSPKAHENEEEGNKIMRQELIKVLRGESSLSMAPATWLPKNEKGDQNGQGG